MSTGVVLNNRKDTGKRQYCPPLPAMDLSNLDSTAFTKEGWLRHKEKWPRSLAAQTGWLFQATDYPNWFGINKRELDTTTPSAPQRMLRSIFFRSRPPLLRKEGIGIGLDLDRALPPRAMRRSSSSLLNHCGVSLE